MPAVSDHFVSKHSADRFKVRAEMVNGRRPGVLLERVEGSINAPARLWYTEPGTLMAEPPIHQPTGGEGC